MSLKQILIRNLKSFRKDAGMSQLALSQRCDTAASYIGEIEIGRKVPSLEMLERIARALHIPAHMLIWEERMPYPRAKIPPTIPDAIKADFAEQLTSTIQRLIRKY